MNRPDRIFAGPPADRSTARVRALRSVHLRWVAAALTVVGCSSSSPASDAGATSDAAAHDAKTDAHPGATDGGTDTGSSATSDAATDGAQPADDGSAPVEASSTSDGATEATTTADTGVVVGDDASADTGPAADVFVPAPANDKCTSAAVIPIAATAAHIDLSASTAGASHDVDAPCVSDMGPDVFYSFSVSKRVFVYADTFGAGWNTVLFLLANDCTPLTASTTPFDAVCNDDACAGSQSQVVAVLPPGSYKLGLSGRGGAEGAATIHFEYALAGGGAVAPLPPGNTVQPGTTSGPSDVTALSSQCIAAGPENSYWWASCPADVGGSLVASTCGGATWETVLAVEIPQTGPYQCSLDACSLQTTINATIPSGAGLRVLLVDGEGGGDKGAYTLTAARP